VACCSDTAEYALTCGQSSALIERMRLTVANEMKE
jgi:hypothetical protein